MKIKIKLQLGIGLLFLMIAVLTVLSILFINKLSKDAGNILVANYNTIDYCRKMQIALNNGITKNESKTIFEQNLQQQQANITEVGEKELTGKLAADFNKLMVSPADSMLQHTVQQDITDIMLLNMQAIQRKSKVADSTANAAILWVSLGGTLCFLIAFVMLVNLPGNIANPIKELANSISEIAAQNYSQRVHFDDHHNEFGELAASFNTMAQKLEEYRAGNMDKLMIEKKRIETLIDNMNDPVIVLDEHRQVLLMNSYALKITGLTRENTIGKPVQDIAMHNDLVHTLVKDLFGKEAGNTTADTGPVKIYADNKESYFEKEVLPIRIIPTGEKQEKHIGNVILLQNITPYKELDFAKTNFIATVSHELKTPIASIKMSLQLLENKQVGELNTEQQSLVESIKDDAARLLKITSELLNMTQVESGRIQLNIKENDAAEMIGYAVNANRSAAEQKQIQLKTDIPPGLAKVMADQEKTAWVLTNLLSNAIRYSYDHSTIFIKAVQENNKMIISVTDTGQGIAPQYISRIFDRYFRIPGTKKEGTGLGLSISKEFMEAQGGQISVTSEFGSGSTFSIELPVAV